jgi:hypothetical protein
MKKRHLSAAAAAMLACGAVAWCSRRAGPSSAARMPAAASAPAVRSGSPSHVPRTSVPEAPPRARARRGGMDLTFLVTADTHIGYRGKVPVPETPSGVDIEEVHEKAIVAMNTITGTPLPRALGGRVGEPRGLLIAGDLTETGRAAEWARFEVIFGLTGREGRIRYPVYEGAGNHDKAGGPHVERQIARRHGGARYAFDWDDVHVVCLGEAPNDEDLAWLRSDLDAVGRDVGIVLYFHFPLAGPYSRGNWFGDGGYHERLHETIAGRRVLGIFTGHYHASGVYRWRGFDAYLVGSAKHSWHAFSVVRVTDERMTVASYNYDRRAFWWWHDKPVFGAGGREAKWFSADADLTGAPAAPRR